MFGRKTYLAISAVLALGFGMSAGIMPSVAQSPELPLLGSLERGEWTVRFRDGSPSRKVCVRNGLELIKLQHASKNCSHYVVEDTSKSVAVQYTCQGEGYARTTIRRETASLVQISSHGIAGGLPFQFEAEARRTGACS